MIKFLLYIFIFIFPLNIISCNTLNNDIGNTDSVKLNKDNIIENTKIKKLTSSIQKENTKLVNDIQIPVLNYHSIRDEAVNEVTLSTDMLRKQLEYIHNEQYYTLSLDEFNNFILNKSPIPQKSILITFDDGYMDNYINAFPILKELKMHATIFCIASELDGSYYLSESAIKDMSNNGIDIASHTMNHKHLSQLNYSEQVNELKKSKSKLESIVSKNITTVAFPFGDYNNDTINAAMSCGYNIAFTTHKGFCNKDSSPLKLNRIYISSNYNMDKFKSLIKSPT